MPLNKSCPQIGHSSRMLLWCLKKVQGSILAYFIYIYKLSCREAEANHMQRFRITFYLHLLTILWIPPNVQPLNCIIMYMYVPIGLSFIDLPSLWPSLGVVVFVGCAGSWITSQSLFGGYPQIEVMRAANKDKLLKKDI